MTRQLMEGNRPDPSILWDGEAYYMVYSTLRYKPGLVVYRSEDLRRWTPVCSALTDDAIRDVWAPDFVRYGGRYYIYFCADGKNYVIWSDRPDEGYSAPVDLMVNGFIDPGHIADEETGQRYLFFNNGYAAPLSADGLKVAAPPVRVAPEWPIPGDWEVEGVYMESPKLCRHGEYYYLTVAQGGTAGPPTSHMAIVMRTKVLPGGWETDPGNPVIHCYSPAEPYWSTGHATPFLCGDGRWRVVYHGYPQYDRGRGRVPLLAEVEWTPDGWYRVKTDGCELFAVQPFTETFADAALSPEWTSFDSTDRGVWVRPGEWRLSAPEGERRVLAIQPIGAEYVFTAECGAVKGSCGIALFYDPRASVGLTLKDGGLWQTAGDIQVFAGDWTAAHAWLRLRLRGQVVSMYVSDDGERYTKCPASFSVDAYTQTVLGGFLSLRPALTAEGGSVSWYSVSCEPLDSEVLK